MSDETADAGAQTDPMHATAAELKRRSFIGLSIGAAAIAGTGIGALGADADMGKPHPPLVPEDDPDITVQRPQLSRPDGAIDAYAAFPRTNSVTTPGVVVVQHLWGVDAQIRDTVRRFAKAGYVTIAPDLYARFNAPSGDGVTDASQFSAIAAKLDDRMDGDIQAGATWVRSRVGAGPLKRPPKVGIIGFCMGGSIALRELVNDAQAFDAGVIFYGKVRRGGGDQEQGPITDQELAYTTKLQSPVMGQYGARDTSIKPDDVRALDTRLTVPHDIKIYDDAGHAFFDDTRPRYVASAARDAWNRTLAWFGKYLKA